MLAEYNSKKLKYIPEIDGLKVIAVISLEIVLLGFKIKFSLIIKFALYFCLSVCPIFGNPMEGNRIDECGPGKLISPIDFWANS